MTEHRLEAIAHLYRENARTFADAPAFRFQEKDLSFKALDAHSNKVAQGFLALGVKPGVRVGFLAKNHVAYFELLGAAAKTRCALMSVNWRLSVPEMAYVLEDAGVEVLFVGKDYYETMNELRTDRIKHVVAIDGGHPSWPSYEEWRDGQKDEDPNMEVMPDDDVVQLYTSGTTGRPKGVCLTNSCYQGFFAQMLSSEWGHTTPEDRGIVILPLYHVAGVNVGLILFLGGACADIHEDVDLVRILRTIEEQKVTFLFLVPALILFLTLTPEAQETDLSSMRSLAYGASPISEDVLMAGQALFKCDFVQVYGLTETNGAATHLPPADHDPARGKLRSCGVVNEHCEVRAVREDGSVAAPGEVGQLQIRSQGVMRCYWNRPDVTAEVISADGWFSSGDAGYLDEEGYVYVHDRLNDMIISGGENIYPAEVENALASHPAVQDVAVVGVPDAQWGEAVKAFVVKVADQEASEADLINHAREAIAHYKCPSSVDFVGDLPRNPTGKILRRELREPFWKNHDRGVS